MTARLGRRTLGGALVASASWTEADLGSIGSEHMMSFAASNHDVPAVSPSGQLATPRASRVEAAQALALLVGTFGILLGLAVVVGTPLAAIR
jgi:hypothetical protein